jgi:serine phosphatase RsbU (regulator of sigma subunit)/ABC-type phosphate/phosphonate transport system substrate-binding protein
MTLYANYKKIALIAILFHIMAFLFFIPSNCDSQEVAIGVLAHKGKEDCLMSWDPTARYLSSAMPEYQFKIELLSFAEIESAIQKKTIDFIIANSSIYTELEIKYFVSRIATMENLALGKKLTMFGGVIFFLSNRDDIHTLRDLKGKKFMAVDATSLGGWRAAMLELKREGIDPESDFLSLQFGGDHINVVESVKDGVVDAGTVRTDTLERLASDGKIKLSDFKIIHYPRIGPIYQEFPFLLSTSLYPEWPIAKLPHTSEELSKKVAAALMIMPQDSQAAKAAHILGWTTPLNYQSVAELLKELRLGPYLDYGKVTGREILKQHLDKVIGISTTLILLSIMSVYLMGLNRKLKIYQAQLQTELKERKRAEEQLADSYHKLEAANQRIMDSIYYARSIQKAILPPESHFTAHAQDHFVIWKPKDIIGGDIFWFNGSGDDFMVAVMDCTGHGVPGAIMTMIAGATLNRIVAEDGYKDPCKILKRMNTLVMKMLSRESENELYDHGLDMGVCYINKLEQRLLFAGAKISLYVSDNADITEIKGDRESLGYRTSNPDYAFTCHDIPIKETMRFYMTTDGVSDQVGGEKRMPFGKSRFKKFIAEHHLKPFDQQQATLVELLHNYQGVELQRDDMTVVGFKI